MTPTRPFAVVTGASSGIGKELAISCAANGFDLLIVANEPMHDAVERCKHKGARVEALEADLSTIQGVDRLYDATGGREIDALLANAGTGLGHAFLDQEFDRARYVIDTNISGTVYLIHRIGNDMRRRGSGRILITGSIAGFVPGSFQAIYNASKAFLNSFSFALREELAGSGVTVTCLMPGATETDFFERADMLDTSVGQADKDNPIKVAADGFDAMMRGDGDIVSGMKNKIQSAAANVTPASVLAKQHRKMAEPGTG